MILDKNEIHLRLNFKSRSAHQWERRSVMDFIGEKCVLCGKTFTAEDDIVVCPECGSPHHRACYKIDNKCANIAMHDAGEKWQPEPKKEEKQPFVVCPACHYPNRSTSETCAACGSRLQSTAKSADESSAERPASVFPDITTGEGMTSQFLGFDPEEDLGGATIREVTQFVGPNTLYYIPIFKRMKDLGSKISFNITCLLFPALYFANRKMWLWTLISTLISVVLTFPAVVLVMAEQKMFTENIVNIIYSHKTAINAAVEICSMINWIVRLIFCLFGNWLYMRYTLRSLKKLRSRSRGGNISPARLAAEGGVQPVNIILALLIAFAVAFVSIYAITFFLPVILAFV